MTSTLPEKTGLHVAIIMDGNGRWATRRGLPRTAGHRAGVEAVRRVVEGAPDLGIGTLTLFAFSSANWQRPAEEVAALMRLMEIYMRAETRRFVESSARLTVIGRRAIGCGRGWHVRSRAPSSRRPPAAGCMCASRSTTLRVNRSPARPRAVLPLILRSPNAWVS
jgi:hypothetical protein